GEPRLGAGPRLDGGSAAALRAVGPAPPSTRTGERPQRPRCPPRAAARARGAAGAVRLRFRAFSKESEGPSAGIRTGSDSARTPPGPGRPGHPGSPVRRPSPGAGHAAPRRRTGGPGAGSAEECTFVQVDRVSRGEQCENMSSENISSEALRLRALAHPVRLDLLYLLREEGEVTATAAAERLGLSPKTCSYHLGLLGKYGLAEETGGGKGRSRPWRLVPQGIGYAPSADDEPATAE